MGKKVETMTYEESKRTLEILVANAENRHYRSLRAFERVMDDLDASDAHCAAAYRGALGRRAQLREARAALASFLEREGGEQ